ncbi:STAND family AAA ATPase [Methylovulum miyakonense]|uniref:STAND family AAA ATPase n=1 Tax=Methylovulum miyakonense TaxID=645578 RepID=UPI0003827C78|nr:metallophosphoesterase [Methylovulum miyakonense]
MKLTILHLSDIHIHNSSDLILKQANKIASACFTSARDSDACLIIVTGDIAYSGEKQQYDEAYVFLSLIKEEIQQEGCPLVDIITVPGNHDCSLIPENKSRTIVIDGVIAYPEEALDENIIDTCTTPQKSYFDFQDQITEKTPIFRHKLWNEYEFIVNEKILRVSAINAAWMSRIPEKQGELVFPIELFSKSIEEHSNIRFALLHQPLNWYCQKSYHPLRQSLRNYADIILSGHEHLSSSGTIKDVHNGSSLYFEAGALQPDESNMPPQFSVIFLSFRSNSVEEYRCSIEEDTLLKQDVNSHLLFDESIKQNGKSELTKDFQNLLADPGGNFTHPEKDSINLDDIFVYPDVKQMAVEITNENIFVSIEKILFKNHIKQRIILLGEEKSGKTTTLLRLFNQYHREGLFPVYIKANGLSSSSEKEIKKLINRHVKSQYSTPSILDLSEKEKKIVLVDDINKVNSRALHSLIQYLEKHFSEIVLTANTEFEFANLVNQDAINSLAAFDTYELQRFNLRLRHQLIKKWCLCGTVNTKPELDEQVHKIEGLVNTIIGKSLVPSQPIYLLILIQSCQRDQQNELQNSSFAYYYQYIITKSFGENGVKREELDALFNYLSQFAWFLRKENLQEIAFKDFKSFNQGFCELFDTVDLNERLLLLCKAKILIKRGEYYSFTYPYIYYYFLGKFLADNLHKTEIKEMVEYYCDNLYKYQNAHAILFLTHHNNNHPWLIKRILSVLQGCFKDCRAMEFDGDVEKINTLIDTTAHLLIAEPDVDKNQENRRQIQDEMETKNHREKEESDEIEEGISVSYKLNLLLRTAEILGQILKNYYGSLERGVKKELINEIFNSPLRFLGTLFESVTNDPLVLVKEIESAIGKEQPHLLPEKKEELAKKLIFHLLGILGTGLILRTAQFVSSSKLQEDISVVVQSNESTNAYKLIEAATHLSQPGHLPLEGLKKLALDIKDNFFAFKILQSLAVYHLYQFHMREPEKQKLCSYLDIEISKSHKIDFQTRKSKLLK